MGYIEKNLLKDEKIYMQAHVSWAVYLPSLFFLCAGVLFPFSIMGFSFKDGFIFTLLGIFLSVVTFILALITRRTTELAVTDRRVVAKRGLIRRFITEIPLSRVESLLVDQSVLGRVLDYGTVVVSGVGQGTTYLRNIDAPLIFRRTVVTHSDNKHL